MEVSTVGILTLAISETPGVVFPAFDTFYGDS